MWSSTPKITFILPIMSIAIVSFWVMTIRPWEMMFSLSATYFYPNGSPSLTIRINDLDLQTICQQPVKRLIKYLVPPLPPPLLR